ncbi:MAG TPA: M28 family peptidase [Novosphingobium sp.]|nr:M28 family peptidase [Novosphingobium sp.]
MDRGIRTTGRLLAFMAALALVLPASAAPRRDRALEGQLRTHIEVLASDEFEGREPGTEGEAKTLRYLGQQWFDIGLVSGTNSPGNEWFVPITLVAREPADSAAQFTRRGRRHFLTGSDALMLTSGKRSLVRDAPVLFVGTARTVPVRTELAGRVALLLDGGQSDGERQDALIAAGAAAVVTVLDAERTLESVAARRKRSGYALASEALGGDLEGFMTAEALDRVLHGGATSVASLRAEAERPGFAPRLLDMTASLEATTSESTIRTHNLIGKLPGRRPDSGAVLFLAHWDHFGVCGEVEAEDRICNGAIDNASGLAALTEIARRLARGPRPDRDIYFLATTAEELGLLGAHAFADNPPVPLSQIVAAFNIDSIALAPAGTPLAIVGRGMTPLDAEIEKVARAMKRRVVPGDAANAYVRRQDGWALLQHDIPTVMVTSAYADLDRVEAFFEGDYHRPSDNLANREIELGGAAEDVAFHVALGRWFGDARRVPPRAR